MDASYRRVNITLLDSQYQVLADQNLNVSGLIRDLLGDYLSANKITIQVNEDTRRMYDTIISNTSATDADIEVHLRKALAKVLERKIGEMRVLQEQLLADDTEFEDV